MIEAAVWGASGRQMAARDAYVTDVTAMDVTATERAATGLKSGNKWRSTWISHHTRRKLLRFATLLMNNNSN
jgi:hypothetical protein